MNRSRIEPLGEFEEVCDAGSSRASPSAGKETTHLDRWLLNPLTSKLDGSRVRILLWDEPAESAATSPPVTVRIADRGALMLLLLDPALNFGELYSSGRITVDGDLLVLLDEAHRYLAQRPNTSRQKKTAQDAPDEADSRRDIHHHYDLGNEFYKLWLDREALQYTCAYYPEKAMALEHAQQAKMHHVCRKLQLKPGERVVEAGGGWGGFAIFMAKNYHVAVRSFNISQEQITYARRWALTENLGDRVEFIEDDYRNISGTYDAFVSIGMLEHLGRGNYTLLGQVIHRVLAPEGRGLVHSIGRDRAAPLNPWIRRRIFPGAYPPTLREMMDIFEPNQLSVLDVENIRLHYALTLQHWLERYEQNLETVRSMFDEDFVRAWRLYLAGSMMAFTNGNLQLFQILFSRSGVNRIPWTRSHLYTPGE